MKQCKLCKEYIVKPEQARAKGLCFTCFELMPPAWHREVEAQLARKTANFPAKIEIHLTWTPGVSLWDLERQVLEKVLTELNGNRTQTARALKLALRTVRNHIYRYAKKDLLK